MILAEAKDLPNFDALWNFGNPVETESKFRALLPEAKSSKDIDLYLQLLTQIARSQGLQRKFDEAHKTLDQVQAGLSIQTQTAEVRYYLERGRVFNSSKKSLESLPHFKKALDLSVARRLDNFAVDSAHMLAIAEPAPEKKLEWNLKALELSEKSMDQKARDWQGSLYNNLGWTYHEAGELEKALEMFQKALAFRESKGQLSSIRIAKWSVARVYRSMKKNDEALKIQLGLEKEFKVEGKVDPYVFEELGELYLLIAKMDLSKKYFAMAYQELSKDEWFKANEAQRLARIQELGGLK